MPDAPPTVPPALTSREWAEIQALPPKTREHVLTRDPAVAARTMALHNFALPDGDPRKLTRDDIAWVRDVIEMILAYSAVDDAEGLPLRLNPEGPTAEGTDTYRGERLAAKLAALLPPP